MFISGKEIIIPYPSFQRFDQRQIIEAPIPSGVTLKVGDTIDWNAAQFEGTCQIVEVCEGGRTVMIEKC